ncbi:hypothetical protein [Desulfurobacterium sp. TC5-1]|uniref:hypothetical protein n=1 Tax=Desulfurobacterium sp. TC5-1 TaxID=1158318 RepID=UPI0003B3908A|nr:hypothetical protein [Desulfurobacterium sp. TC5-1]
MKETLKKLAEESKDIKALAIVDEEGLIIAEYSKPNLNFDIEEMASLIITPALRLSEAFTDVDKEEKLEEMVVFLSHTIVILYKLAYETYLVAALEKTPLYGKVRFIVKKNLVTLRETL